eukprot:GFUD01040651.1.p1 GENE.GFUD01040651.1~~GFUD01040651.1.p1  ORF type:complete len:420 (+),score=88.66 GFUD01040651.1:195-1454(+)
MVSTIKNTAHTDHILQIMEYGLSKGCFSDVLISVTGSKKVIRCHKSVLAKSSAFMSSLLDSRTDTQEQVAITLCDLTFSEAMAMMNLVYVGRVKLSNDQLETTKAAAKTFLNIDVEIEKFEPEKVVKKPRKRKVVHNIDPKVNSKRPLMIKTSSPQHPIFFVMPAPPSGPSIKPDPSSKSEDISFVGIPTSESDHSHGPDSEARTGDLMTMNSYQRAKLRCADKFKCDICGKGFPLSCLLQRHKRTHSDVKPFSCNYCDKCFSSKTSLNHHLFMRHLEEQSKRIEMGKKLIDSLKQEQNENVEIIGSERILDGQGQVIKVLADGDYVIEDQGNNHKNVENMEIIGVQDITQQIAVQMGRDEMDTVDRRTDAGRDISETVVAADGGERGPGPGKTDGGQYCDNLYYIESGTVPDYWEYKA